MANTGGGGGAGGWLLPIGMVEDQWIWYSPYSIPNITYKYQIGLIFRI